MENLNLDEIFSSVGNTPLSKLADDSTFFNVRFVTLSGDKDWQQCSLSHALIFVLDGKLQVRIKDAVRDVFKGELALIRQGMDYRSSQGEETRLLSVEETKVVKEDGLDNSNANRIKANKILSTDKFNMLTPREKECVSYLTRGMSYKEISNELGLSSRTVEGYFAKIKFKLGCNSRSSIVNRVFSFY